MATTRKKIAVTKTSAAAKKPAARVAQLQQDIVIRKIEGARTGAQVIAPDHSPRSRPSASSVKPKAGMLAAEGSLKDEVEQFLFLQSELLDNKNWQGFIDLFADDGIYWMPVLPEQTDWQHEASIFAEDKLMMEVRRGRVMHPTAWSQAPMWMTNHLIGNIAIESVSAEQVVVRSRFHLMELRRDHVRHFGGTYRHTLHRSKAGLRILMQRVDMFNAQAPYDYVLQVWV
jgi:3-phenylpropionate/cinnamic acid dioxygenase small subunit